MWLLLCKNESRSITIQEVNTGGKTLVQLLIVVGHSRQGVTDYDYKREIKSQTLHTCMLFLLTRFFQCISNWSKAFELLPIIFLRYTQSNKCPFFPDKQFSGWLCMFIYKLGQHFFIYHSWHTSNPESTNKNPPFIKNVLCFDVDLVSNY